MTPMDRRTFLASMSSSLVVPSVFMEGAEQPAHPSLPAALPAPRNVVVFICDDLGFGDLGCYGSKIPTPNLDRMAQQGRRFLHYDTAHPICSASRAALLTGRYGPRSGVTGAFMPHSKTGMALEETTLANLFQQSGFRTQAIGKWHLGDAEEYLPTHRGFDSFYGVPYSVDMQPLKLIHDTIVLEEDTDRNLLTQRYTQAALQFLDQHSAKPFFLYVAFSYPHDPARASLPFRGRSGLGDFGDAVHEIDWSVGEILRGLQQHGQLDDTLVLFTSDHGPWYQGNPGNLRGRKSTCFEGGCRVPLIARWPGKIPAGSVSEAWATHLDILPTMTRLCGLHASPNPLDGTDLSGVLLGDQKTVDRKAMLYFTPNSSHGMDLHCARKENWKVRFAQINGEMYINDYTTGHESFWLTRPELYNLALDPAESYCVAKQHPEIVRQILAEVEAQIPGMPEVVQSSYARLRLNTTRITTPPAAAPRPASNAPLPAWAWEPKDRRS